MTNSRKSLNHITNLDSDAYIHAYANAHTHTYIYIYSIYAGALTTMHLLHGGFGVRKCS